MKITLVALVLITSVCGFLYAPCFVTKPTTAVFAVKSNHPADTLDLSLCSGGGAYHIPFSVVLPLAQDIPGYHSLADSLVMIHFLQNKFDEFSWRTFIALNWPSLPNGNADTTVCFTKENGETVWENWMPSTKIFVPTGQQPQPWKQGVFKPTTYFAAFTGAKPIILAAQNLPGNVHPLNSGLSSEFRIGKVDSMFTIFDAEQYPVVDAQHMYTLYENFYNKQAYDYIVKSKLYSQSGQAQFAKTFPSYTKGLLKIQNGDTMNIEKTYQRAYFPVGNVKDSSKSVFQTTYPDPKDSSKTKIDTTTLSFSTNEGAIIIKSAWIILTNRTDFNNYLTRTVKVKQKNGGYKVRTLGLVGMHIIHKVAEVTQWVWSSFEHIDNAPYLDDNGKAILEPGVNYLYFDERHNDSDQYNKHPDSIYQPNPFSRKPSQVVSVRRSLPSTDSINDQFHALIAKLDKNSIWMHYRLVGTQWAFNPTLFTSGSDYKPALLGNPIMETYVQTTSSCMSCHSAARFLQNSSKTNYKYGYNADFVWGLSDAK